MSNGFEPDGDRDDSPVEGTAEEEEDDEVKDNSAAAVLSFPFALLPSELVIAAAATGGGEGGKRDMRTFQSGQTRTGTGSLLWSPR